MGASIRRCFALAEAANPLRIILGTPIHWPALATPAVQRGTDEIKSNTGNSTYQFQLIPFDDENR